MCNLWRTQDFILHSCILIQEESESYYAHTLHFQLKMVLPEFLNERRTWTMRKAKSWCSCFYHLSFTSMNRSLCKCMVLEYNVWRVWLVYACYTNVAEISQQGRTLHRWVGSRGRLSSRRKLRGDWLGPSPFKGNLLLICSKLYICEAHCMVRNFCGVQCLQKPSLWSFYVLVNVSHLV